MSKKIMKIMMFACMSAMTLPMYGALLTFTQIGQVLREYFIIKSWSELIQETPVKSHIVRQNSYHLEPGETRVQIPVQPGDTVEVVTYVPSISNVTVLARAIITKFEVTPQISEVFIDDLKCSLSKVER